MKLNCLILISAFFIVTSSYAADPSPAPASSPASASNPAPASSPTFHVQQIDPNFDASKMAGPGVKVHSADDLNKGTDKLPSTKVRDEAFTQAGLKDDVNAFDELDKDQLYLRARSFKVDRLKKAYPKISADKLVALQAAIKKQK